MTAYDADVLCSVGRVPLVILGSRLVPFRDYCHTELEILLLNQNGNINGHKSATSDLSANLINLSTVHDAASIRQATPW